MELKEGISIKVTAKFEVDEATVRTCINLLNIYGLNKHLQGMVINFDEHGVEIHEIKSLMAMESVRRSIIEED